MTVAWIVEETDKQWSLKVGHFSLWLRRIPQGWKACVTEHDDDAPICRGFPADMSEEDVKRQSLMFFHEALVGGLKTRLAALASLCQMDPSLDDL
jgi:hypothetical protein